MAAIQVGDLVSLYRRKVPGLGLVVKKTHNLADHAGFDEEIFKYAPDPRTAGRTPPNWWYRIEEAIRDAADPDAAQSFVNYNHYGAKKTKLKKSFIRVRWVRKPSDYHATTTFSEEQWIPSDWAKPI